MRRHQMLCNFGIDTGGGEPYPGYDWYVDSVNGDDSNDGTSSTAALKTIAALEAKTIQAGDKIGLAKGSTWREQLDIAVDTVTVEAYGASGNNPLLDASNVAANASFAKTVGQTNVYEISITPEWAASKNWLNVYENDVHLTRAADLATCDATPGSCFPSAATGTITLYVHPRGSSNPTSDGKTYEYSQRLYGIAATSASNLVLTGIHTRRNLHEDGSTVTDESAVFTNCTFSDGSKHNILVGDGSLVDTCLLENAYYSTGDTTLAVHNQNVAAGLGVTYRDSTFRLDTFSSPIIGINGHVNTSGNFGVVTVTGCTFQNLGKSMTGVGATAITFTNNTITDCSIGLEISQAGIVYTLSGNVYNNLATGSPRAIITSAAATVNIDGDTYTGGDVLSGLIAILNNNSVFNISNSLLQLTASTAADGCILINTGLTGVVLTLNGTSLIANAGQNIRALAAPATYTGNNNCYGTTNNTAISIRWGGNSYGTLAGWQAVTSQDANSTVGGCS